MRINKREREIPALQAEKLELKEGLSRGGDQVETEGCGGATDGPIRRTDPLEGVVGVRAALVFGTSFLVPTSEATPQTQ